MEKEIANLVIICLGMIKLNLTIVCLLFSTLFKETVSAN